MRVPVRLGAEGPRYYGPRHAPTVNMTRRARYYGGDVRRADPLSLVFRGHLGARLADDMELTINWPSDSTPAIDPTPYSLDYGAAPATLDTSWLNQFEVPAYTPPTSDILRSQSAGIPYPAGTVPIVPAESQIFGGESTQGGGSSSSDSWWQTVQQGLKILPAIVGAGATIATASIAASRGTVVPTRQVYNPATGQMQTVAAPQTYTIPATATQPAQRVTYDPATGQVTSVPLTGLNAVLPSFLQTDPNAAWYQNPLVWIGGGGLLLIVALMAGRR